MSRQTTHRSHGVVSVTKTADDNIEVLTTYGRFVLEISPQTPIAPTHLLYLVDELKEAIRD
jgi:hypothetical protein